MRFGKNSRIGLLASQQDLIIGTTQSIGDPLLFHFFQPSLFGSSLRWVYSSKLSNSYSMVLTRSVPDQHVYTLEKCSHGIQFVIRFALVRSSIGQQAFGAFETFKSIFLQRGLRQPQTCLTFPLKSSTGGLGKVLFQQLSNPSKLNANCLQHAAPV